MLITIVIRQSLNTILPLRMKSQNQGRSWHGGSYLTLELISLCQDTRWLYDTPYGSDSFGRGGVN